MAWSRKWRRAEYAHFVTLCHSLDSKRVVYDCYDGSPGSPGRLFYACNDGVYCSAAPRATPTSAVGSCRSPTNIARV